MDEKRYCVHAALGRRGDRLRLVRVRPGRSGVEHGMPNGASNGASGVEGGALDAAAGRVLPLTGSRPVVLAEGLTQAQAERLAALLSGLVDADAAPNAAPNAVVDAPLTAGPGSAPTAPPDAALSIVPEAAPDAPPDSRAALPPAAAQWVAPPASAPGVTTAAPANQPVALGGSGPFDAPGASGASGPRAVAGAPEEARLKARQGLALLREALLAVMAANPGGLSASDMRIVLGLGGESSQGMKQLLLGLLELLRETGVVRHNGAS